MSEHYGPRAYTYITEGYDDRLSSRRPRNDMFNEALYNWPRTFAPPPPPPTVVNCGELRRSDVGKNIEICGRVQKICSERFVFLKDTHGLTQLVIPVERIDLQNRFKNMPMMSAITVVGQVHARPGRGQNEKMATGCIEVIIDEIVNVQVNKNDAKIRSMSTVPQHIIDGSAPKVTSEEYHKFHGLLTQLKERKYTCAHLPNMINQHVQLLCWVEKNMKKFVTLADGYAKIQCIIPSEKIHVSVLAEHLVLNAVVNVSGVIKERPKYQINTTSSNGHIELQVESLDWPMFDLKNIADEASGKVAIDESSASPLNKLTVRTHTCGELRLDDVGKPVVLCGWLQLLSGDKFIQLRDAFGSTQCLYSNKEPPIKLSKIKLESVLKVTGLVSMRPPNMIQEAEKTGEIEVIINDLTILSEASMIPFIPNPHQNYDDDVRIQYRYVELRRARVRDGVRLRSAALQTVRRFLVDTHRFVETDTPSLVAPLAVTGSPRVDAGRGDGRLELVRSPLLHMHLLMIGMLDRCFNISKVYLTTAEDGQVERSCLHLGVSFADAEHAMALVEGLLRATLPHAAPPAPARLAARAALATYGSLTPDLSYDLKLHDVTEAMNDPKGDNYGAYAIIYPRSLGKLSNNLKSVWISAKARYSAVQLSDGGRDLAAPAESAVRALINLDQSKSFIVACGDREQSCLCLGELRTELANDLSSKSLLNKCKPGMKPAWITEPPLFPGGAPGLFSLAAPHEEDPHDSPDDILKARAQGFSLVLSGSVLATGYVPNRDARSLRTQLTLAHAHGAPADHVLRAVQSGCPPCVLVTVDMDKLVALASNMSAWEAIPFPKTKDGLDPFSVEGIQNPQPVKRDVNIVSPGGKMPRLN